MTVLVERLAVIGVGLIGGSFSLALKEAGAVGMVMGCGRTVKNLQDALSLGLVDDATTDPAEAADGADVVLFSVPVREVPELCKSIRHALKPGCVITDAGSTKEVLVQEMFAHLPPYVHIVGGHPIAGSEKTGAIAADSGLFKNRITIVTPQTGTDRAAVELVKKLWETVGARVEVMEPAVHDVILGAVSHLPHMVAYALVAALMEWNRDEPMLRFSAGGLRDFTRVAASSPEMWRDICIDNRYAIVEAIDRFSASLSELKGLIAGQDAHGLTAYFEKCRKVRESL